MKRPRVKVLPVSIIKSLNEMDLTPANYNNAVAILSIILYEKGKKKLSNDDYNHISSNYWKKAVGAHYYRSLRPMVLKGMIQDTPYWWSKGLCRAYRINPDLMTGEVGKLIYEGTLTKSDRSSECRSTVRFMRSLSMNVRAAKTAVEKYITSKAYQADIQVDPDIDPQTIIGIKTSNNADDNLSFRSVKVWKEIAQSEGDWLIKDGNNFTIDDPERFFHEKESNIRISYLDTIYRFQNLEFYARRNDTNKRLDSNLSSMPSMLLNYLTFNGESLVSIDLRNSQFVMLATILQGGLMNHLFDVKCYKFQSSTYYSINESNQGRVVTYNSTKSGIKIPSKSVGNPVIAGDVALFIKLAKSGDLYEYIQVNLNLPTGSEGRGRAKRIMFEVFFSGKDYRGNSKQQIKKIFPTLIDICDQLKKAYKDNSVAIVLQLMESRIFIDLIKKELDNRGFSTATKHDSVLCAVSQLEGVEATIREILGVELGEYQLKIEKLD